MLLINWPIYLYLMFVGLDIKVPRCPIIQDTFHLQIEKVLVDILFLEASDKKLISRYKETRRTHPLSEEGSLLSAIERERSLLSDIKGISNFVIDTTEKKPKELKQELGNLPDEFVCYFSEKFPKLLAYIYEAIQPLKDEANFREYYDYATGYDFHYVFNSSPPESPNAPTFRKS